MENMTEKVDTNAKTTPSILIQKVCLQWNYLKVFKKRNNYWKRTYIKQRSNINAENKSAIKVWNFSKQKKS